MNIKNIFTKKFFTKKKIIVISVVLVVAVTGIFVVQGTMGKKTATASLDDVKVTRGDINVTIEASGVIEPISRYEITSLVKGTVISSPFEEGDTVKKGDLLYKIDDTDAALNIEKTQNSISKANLSSQTTNDSIRKLTIYAPSSGTLTGFDVEVGDQLNTQKIGEIIDNENLKVKIPFNGQEFEQINIGDSAAVTSAQYMSTISGTVTYKYNATSTSAEGSQLQDVEITVSNPGALGTDISVGATVYTSSGSVMSAGSGTLKSGSRTSVIPETAGKVESVYVKDGQNVVKGQKLVQLSNDTLYSTRDQNNLNMRDYNLTLQSQSRTLEDYNLTSPIDGVVITKTAKAGDNINSGTSREVLMVVADINRMIFTIDVDEMDIAKVQLGQSVIVDADALSGKTFNGEVTKVAGEGTAANGVTTYAVEITIAEPGDLKPGMNVNANIVVESKQNVLMLSESAVTVVGTTGFGTVLVKDKESAPAPSMMPMRVRGGANGEQAPADGEVRMRGEGNPEGQTGEGGQVRVRGEGGQEGQVPSDGQARVRDGNAQEGQQTSPNASGAPSASGMPQGGMRTMVSNLPEGYSMRPVRVGISDGKNIEIIEGLTEGDTIGVQASGARSSTPNMMMGGGMMGGGMGGGARPQGSGTGGGQVRIQTR